jgi:4a-hydroxytetrahydrobiopterin dehydratase
VNPLKIWKAKRVKLLNKAKLEHDRSHAEKTLKPVKEMLKEKMTEQEVSIAIAKLPDWKIIDSKLSRAFKFHDFVDACAFMTKVSLVSEKMDHHPEFINSYNRVNIGLFTHDLDGISSLDIELAKKIDTLV